jgi:hypothetical protein
MPALHRRRAGETRWEEDNRLALNPWAFLAVAVLAGALVGLALLIWLL